MSIDAAENILLGVATFFRQIFYLFSGLLRNTGFYWIFGAMILAVVVSRLIIFPILGGSTFNLGIDKVTRRSSRSNNSRED